MGTLMPTSPSYGNRRHPTLWGQSYHPAGGTLVLGIRLCKWDVQFSTADDDRTIRETSRIGT